MTQESKNDCDDSYCTHKSGGVDEYALDFSLPYGTPIISSSDAMAYIYKEDKTVASAYGNHLKLNHGYFYTLYAHLSSFSSLTENCENGCEILAGSIIGYAGSTGYSSGSHLHFGLYHGYAWEDGYSFSVPSKIIIGNEGYNPYQAVYSTDLKKGNSYLSENFLGGREGIIICGNDDVNCYIDYEDEDWSGGTPTKNSSVKVREIQISDDDDKMISHSLIKELSQKYHIHSVLENTGDEDVYDIELQYYISEDKIFGDDDDKYLASDWINQIDAGESYEDRKTQDESGDQLRTPNQEGLFYIFAIAIVDADNSANISDSNDDDEYSKLAVKEYIPTPPLMEIEITNPSSRERWKTDRSHSINWKTTNIPRGSHVKIEYYLYEKKKWYVIDDSTPNDGKRNWDMEDKPYRDIIKRDSDAKIRITVIKYPKISNEVKFKIDHKK